MAYKKKRRLRQLWRQRWLELQRIRQHACRGQTAPINRWTPRSLRRARGRDLRGQRARIGWTTPSSQARGWPSAPRLLQKPSYRGTRSRQLWRQHWLEHQQLDSIIIARSNNAGVCPVRPCPAAYQPWRQRGFEHQKVGQHAGCSLTTSGFTRISWCLPFAVPTWACSGPKFVAFRCCSAHSPVEPRSTARSSPS